MPGVTNFTRTCTKCRYSKTIRGSITSPRFICSDCRTKTGRSLMEYLGLWIFFTALFVILSLAFWFGPKE